ncbi:MAG: zinc ABC transporter substrate-binding protein [Gammaproteobacteria bacterium]|nr:zinc ABC transporter substrate-binding protein [Gammaproteobacteria bacterium]
MAAGSDPVRAHVSIKPLQFLVEQVGGRRVEIAVVVEAGQSPETYEPTPRQISGLADADIFFGVGMPLEPVWRRQLRQTGSSAPQWVDLSDGLPADPDAHDDHGENESEAGTHYHHGGIDPHIWLSPVNAQHMATGIADALAAIDPANADRYRENAETLRTALTALDREISETLADSGVDAFLVYHPAWGHFARAYDLEQISIESEGKQPGPRGLVEVVQKAEEKHIKTLFIDPMHNDRLARTVADAIGARLEVLDPLALDYFDNLRRTARVIADSRS